MLKSDIEQIIKVIETEGYKNIKYLKDKSTDSEIVLKIITQTNQHEINVSNEEFKLLQELIEISDEGYDEEEDGEIDTSIKDTDGEIDEVGDEYEKLEIEYREASRDSSGKTEKEIKELENQLIQLEQKLRALRTTLSFLKKKKDRKKKNKIKAIITNDKIKEKAIKVFMQIIKLNIPTLKQTIKIKNTQTKTMGM